MPSDRPAGRRAYIDWARGLAVLLMIEAHTLDSWTLPAAKHSSAFTNAIVLGGFAAPLFLWLAGIATVLSAARYTERLGSRRSAVEAVCRRGLEIFILAFLFRLQAFLVSPGSYLVSLFRVDILNIMGPAIVAAGLMWALTDRPAILVLTYAAAATGVAMLTPIIRTAAVVDRLPLWVQWHVRPFGDFTTFTAFPWMGFVLGGAACGALLTAATDARSTRRLHLSFVAIGLALVMVGFSTAAQPSIYRQSSFWSTSPTWFAIRAGLMIVALSALYWIETPATRWVARPLERLGRSSLFVYWIHVELVYGYASFLWRGRLPMWGSVAGFVIFSFLMYRVVRLRDEWTARWHGRLPRAAGAHPVSPVDGAMVT